MKVHPKFTRSKSHVRLGMVSTKVKGIVKFTLCIFDDSFIPFDHLKMWSM